MRMFLSSRPIVFFLALTFFVAPQYSCSEGGNFNLLSLEDDIELGRGVEQEIAASPQDFPLLPEQANAEVYQYVRGIASTILNSGKVKYKDEFPWTVRIIHDDNTINAFCAPGGFIYVYTGLIKFLDSEDELAGVMGHEIAHADLRHSSRQLTKIYGISLIAEALLGENQALLKEISTSLIALSFSRDHETESDKESVKYLCPTEWNAAGSAGFFQKMEGQPNPPVFLSTHPNPEGRVKTINDEKAKLACTGSSTFDARYAQMKALLP